jgi:hypothetical protein
MTDWIADEVLGRQWRAFDGKFYLATEHDPRCGVWIEELANPSNRRNVSERAFNRTIHQPQSFGPYSELETTPWSN